VSSPRLPDPGGASSSPAHVRFGTFELDLRSGELRKQGRRIRLAEQPFHVLRVLLQHPGELVTREALQRELWSDDTFVDFDVGLNGAIRKLRDALGDSADNPVFVETVPRHGYRFIAPLTGLAEPVNGHPFLPQAALTAPVASVSERGEAVAAGAKETKPIDVEAVDEPNVHVDGPALGRRAIHVTRRTWLVLMVAIAVAAGAIGAVLWVRNSVFGPRITLLVVLPFENLTGDASQDYFVDGMTDELTTELANIVSVDVISRQSAKRYQHSSIAEIRRALNVDAAIQGTIEKSGHHVKVTAQLVNVATDRLRWAQSYEGELSDVIALQQQIARAIASAVGDRMVSAEATRTPRPVDPGAYEAYLKGISLRQQESYEGFQTAIKYLESAIAKQPDFASAYAAIGLAQLQFLYTGSLAPSEVIPKAEAATRKAIALDPGLADAHRTLGLILQNYYWDWNAASRELTRAQDLAHGTARLGVSPLLLSGRVHEAIEEAERIRRLDPLSFNAYMDTGAAYRADGQYDRAISEFRQGLKLAPRPRGDFQIGLTYIIMDRLNDAIPELQTAVTLSRGNPRFKPYLGYAYAAAGHRLEAQGILRDLESLAERQYVSSFGRALIYDALGQQEAALAALERAYADHAVEFTQVAYAPVKFKTIASEPRFQAIMRRIGRTP
jgi:TolB-like protein/DNA-binding winged helix-turn-helix (wHTH) protein